MIPVWCEYTLITSCGNTKNTEQFIVHMVSCMVTLANDHGNHHHHQHQWQCRHHHFRPQCFDLKVASNPSEIIGDAGKSQTENNLHVIMSEQHHIEERTSSEHSGTAPM